MVSSHKDTVLHTGIVLRSMQSSDDRVVIFDKTLGKIYCVFPEKNVCSGSYIEYVLRRKKSCYVAYHCNILKMPFGLSSEEIAFLHHVLEVSNFFLPEGVFLKDVFDHVVYGMQRYAYLPTAYLKKIYLAKLLVLLGVYVEHTLFKETDWLQLINEPIDVILIKLLKANVEQALTEWLYMCITAHPHARYFKTLTFIKEM